jgi:hypothetical protein
MELKDFSENISLDLNKKHIQHLNKLSCYPKKLTGKIDTIYNDFKETRKYSNYILRYNTLKANGFKNSLINTFLYYMNKIFLKIILKIKETNNSLKILDKKMDLELYLNNTENVIIYYQFGGGEDSIEAIKLFKIKESIKNLIINKINSLGIEYDSVHIRNTDYSTDYILFLQSIHKKLIGRKVLLCTDDSSVLEAAKEILNKSAIFTFQKFHNLDYKNKYSFPIHYQWHLSKKLIFENNINTLTDLIGISKSKNFYYTQLNKNKLNTLISGFSKLGENLKNNMQLTNGWLNEY